MLFRSQGSTCVTEGVSVETAAAAPFASATGGTGENPVYAASAVVTDVPSPKITGIRVEGDAVVLTVANTVDALDYAISAGTTPAANDNTRASSPVSGAAAKGAVIELRMPRDPNATSQFFRVGRNPLN